MSQRIKVAAAVIYNSAGEILIARRPETAHQGGLWEFPGGKLEPGEAAVTALKRELMEELGIDILKYQPWKKISHDYPDKQVLLDVWKVHEFSGQAHGREGQQVRWCSVSKLHEHPFPAANQPIIASLICDKLSQTS